jgi:hypothetical protein
LLAASTAAVLAACSVMESTLTEYVPDAPLDAPVPRNCHSSLGAYFLPRGFIKVEVKQYTKKGTRQVLHNSLDNLEVIVRPDTRRMFCLDYLESPLSSDQIQVKKTSIKDSNSKTTPSQLLDVVASNAVDQSALILRRLIRTVFTAIGGFRDVGFNADSTAVFQTVADFEFDPFDQRQSAHINDRLRDYGFCLVLEQYTFGQSTLKADSYCRNPLGFMERETAFGRSYAEFDIAAIAPRSPGILYRPRAVFQLHVYVQNVPKSKEPWLLRKTMPVALENVSPILSIGVDRAAFTKKQIALVFDRGVLKNVCIIKGSELLEAISIPLEVVKSIAKLPTEMLQIQYDQISKSAELARAEQALLTSQKSLISLLQNPTSSTSAASSSAPAGPDKFELPALDTDLATPDMLGVADFRKFYTDCVKDPAG